MDCSEGRFVVVNRMNVDITKNFTVSNVLIHHISIHVVEISSRGCKFVDKGDLYETTNIDPPCNNDKSTECYKFMKEIVRCK